MYPIAAGELAVETGGGYQAQRRSSDLGVFPLQLLYGLFPNMHLGFGTTLDINPRAVHDETKSGDLQLSGLYNFNQETLKMPAFGTEVKVNFPTGVGSAGTDVELKGLVTKSIGRLSFHGNAGGENKMSPMWN